MPWKRPAESRMPWKRPIESGRLWKRPVESGRLWVKLVFEVMFMKEMKKWQALEYALHNRNSNQLSIIECQKRYFCADLL
jgi:hypothetical protein